MDEAKVEKKEMTFIGIPASPGIAFGEAFVVNVEEQPVTEERIAADRVEAEIDRFMAALAETETELGNLHKALEDEMGEEHGKILDTHRMILADEIMRGDTIRAIRERRVTAAYALHLTLDKVLTTFASIKDEFLRERAADIRDVRRRLLHNLLGQKVEGLSALRKKEIGRAHV